jgi:mannosylglucosylglycerate synthase
MNIGFVSFRFAGTDGVSLEVTKWAAILEEMGHTCFYFAGQCDRPAGRSLVVAEAFYQEPEILARHQALFSRPTRTPDDTVWIEEKRAYFRKWLHEFIARFNLDLLIPQNVLAIPLNIPLALALTDLIAETGIPTIAQHHDLAWERKRFLVNGVGDYLSAAFPPDLPSIQHVVINSLAQQQLAHRRGLSSTLIPNVMDFATPPPPPDDYTADVRQALALAEDELLILQPTRVISRKGIEHALELVARLERPSCLVISHASGDEGNAYERRLRQYAGLLGVEALFVSDIIGEERSVTAVGRKIYSLADIYPHANFVTYPSLIEGFGNAFLEAVYFRKPLLVQRYDVYAADIGPKGFQVVEFDEFITEETVTAVTHLLDNPDKVATMTTHNYHLALEHYSFHTVSRSLQGLIAQIPHHSAKS